MLPGLPKPGTSWCLPGAAMPTQAAVTAGQSSYPTDAFGAYRISVDPDCLWATALEEKFISNTCSCFSWTSPFTSLLFLHQLAFHGALSRVSTKQFYSVSHSQRCLQPLWAGGLESSQGRCRLWQDRQTEFNLLTEIQSKQLQFFWAFLHLSVPLVWQREAVLPVQHLPRFSKREMCSK